MHEMPLLLPRSAFSPREAARAGDMWRLFQDVAVGGSMQAGWPPERYRDEGVSFIVRSMEVVHHRETLYGEPLTGHTWPSRIRRAMFFQRECRITGPGGPVASATQHWVHVSSALDLVKASEEMLGDFLEEEHGPSVMLPDREPVDRVEGPSFTFECWRNWMDPLAHVNHPAYVDWCDEALARWLASAGHDPVRLQPVAESAKYKGGVVAGETVTVATALVAQADGAAVFEHVVRVGDERAKLTTVRRLHGEEGPSALLALPSAAE